MRSPSPTAVAEAARLSRVAKSFRKKPVLRDVDIAITAGEIVGIVGHNGSGKTTLLRILSTTVLPDSGTVSVDGVDALRDPLAARRRVGVTLADERAWYWRLTGRENLEFFAALHGLSRREAAARSTELIQEVGLRDAIDQVFGEYSSGMRLRLSLARALLGDPRLILLDEPTRSIDPAGAAAFRKLISDQVTRTDAAVLLVSHDIAEVAQLCSRALVMHAGEPPLEINGRPTVDSLSDALGVSR